MTLPWQFPDPKDEARRRAEAFQRLPPPDRWRELGSMMAFGWAMIRSSPRRTAIEKRLAEQELQWRQIQQAIFARHGR